MTAAVMTPTSVQKTYLPATAVTGTPIRLVRYFVVVTTVTTADWIVAATYCPGTYLGGSGYTIDSSGDGVAQAITYVAIGTKIVMTCAAVGTVYLEILCQEA